MKPKEEASSGTLILAARFRTFWGARAPSRAHFGVLAEIAFLGSMRSPREEVRDHEGVIASTRGACAPQNP